MWIIGGVLLGVLSRFEELTDGFYLAISTNPTWCASAFLVGRPSRAIGFLIVANASYYAYIAVMQPAVELASVAGPLEKWFVLSILTGAVFGRRHWTAALALLTVTAIEVTGAGATYLP